MEKILSIEETTKKVGKYGYQDGFLIKTTEQEIWLGIDNAQSCCENWGYFMSNDNLEDFLGANLLGVKLTDDSLSEAKLKEHTDYGSRWWEGGIMFVNLETNRGTLQFVAYNEHNGYYGHTATVLSTQLKEEEYL